MKFPKTLALILFIVFPVMGFLLGRYYQQTNSSGVGSLSIYENNDYKLEFPSGWSQTISKDNFLVFINKDLDNILDKQFEIRTSKDSGSVYESYMHDCNFSYFEQNNGSYIGITMGTESDVSPFPFSKAVGYKQSVGINNFNKTHFGQGFACWINHGIYYEVYYQDFINTKIDDTFHQILSTFKFTN
ncbi:hypothetical protein BH10PAT1_BH10PAT1_7630 [soil metagenome]